MNALTILGTSLLLAVFVLAGRSGGAIGQTSFAPAGTWQDAVLVSPSARMPTPGSPTPAPTPYSETSSTFVEPHSHAESSVSAVRALICSYAAWSCSEALSVAFCESRYDPAAENPSGAKGVFQLKIPLHEARVDGDVFVAAVNIEAAYHLWEETRDWRHWEECR